METHGSKPGGAVGSSLSRAPAAWALSIVNFVLWLEPSDKAKLVLWIEAPTFKSFLASHVVHTNGAHVILNILVILFAGSVLESRWGTLRFVAFYLFCAWGAAGAAIILAVVLPMAGPSFGATGAALGALAAIGFLYPERRLLRTAPPLKHVVWVLIFAGGAGLAVLEVSGPPAGLPGPILLPQLAGVAFALLFLRLEPFSTRLAERWRARREADRRKKVGEIRSRVDDLLAKISAEGYDSLTRDEKSFLERASRHFRGR
jgi:membrane associated rhomboid family serine protease